MSLARCGEFSFLHSSIRVLLVDDHQAWRSFASDTVQQRPELRVVGEASDGLQAVQIAQELQPDLVLMDIGLPSLNGIGAAQQIRHLSPNSKILFMTENRSPDIAKKALGKGANGYIVKSEAVTQLLAAIDAVLKGKRFVSDSLSLVREQGHVVQFYRNDTDLLDSLGPLFSDELRAGDSVAAVVTRVHREGLLQRLAAQGFDVADVTKKGRLVVLDANEALDGFMDADQPNRERFLLEFAKVICATRATASVKNRPLVVFGEMVAVLREQKKFDAAVRLEQLWNELALTESFYLCCAYPAGEFSQESDDEHYATICTAHTDVVSAFW